MLLPSGAPASVTITLGTGAFETASTTRPTMRPFGAAPPRAAGAGTWAARPVTRRALVMIASIVRRRMGTPLDEAGKKKTDG